MSFLNYQQLNLDFRMLQATALRVVQTGPTWTNSALAQHIKQFSKRLPSSVGSSNGTGNQRLSAESKLLGVGGLTVEEVLGEGIVGHKLGDKQPLLAVAAVADKVGQPPVPQLAHPPRLLLQLTKINNSSPKKKLPNSACHTTPGRERWAYVPRTAWGRARRAWRTS